MLNDLPIHASWGVCREDPVRSAMQIMKARSHLCLQTNRFRLCEGKTRRARVDLFISVAVIASRRSF